MDTTGPTPYTLNVSCCMAGCDGHCGICTPLAPPSRLAFWKRWIIAGLGNACVATHPIVHRRPWLWINRMPVCPLAHLSSWLGERWGDTEYWKPV